MNTQATSTQPTAAKPIDTAPQQVDVWLKEGKALLVDVREDFEHASESIPGAISMPLSRFDAEALRTQANGRTVVFHCQTGRRSADAASRFRQSDEPVHHLAGGIEAWKSSARPTERSASAPKISVMRQVQITAGSLILLGVVLGALVNEWFFAISAFVGAGLLFAGLSGWCGMAMLLAKMPWNRIASTRSCTN